ncbi:hypothetical protein FQ186_22520 [Pseudomonas sp. ANT_H14]|nr:hypothetical protein FQ182_25800 [Pseudomonas sp. ANT_H4]KAA0949874.1 hypothetical protein FQ186_22520 [Pseudomonas sp. ANT_H14]
MLAMVVNDDMGFLDERGALRFFASAARSKLAPTVDPLLLFTTHLGAPLPPAYHRNPKTPIATRNRTALARWQLS